MPVGYQDALADYDVHARGWAVPRHHRKVECLSSLASWLDCSRVKLVRGALTMTKSTATLQVEWHAEQGQSLKEVTTIGEQGRSVVLKVIGEPIMDALVVDTSDRQLRHCAAKAAGYVELLVSACKHKLLEASREAATAARMEVRDAIALLEAFERALTHRIELP